MLDKQSVDELLLIGDHTRIDSVPLYRNGTARGVLCGGEDIPAKRKRIGRSSKDATLPRVAFRDVAACWFLYQDKAYCVQSAPVAILRRAIHSLIRDDHAQALLKQDYLDIVERWYVICEARELKLYKSRYEAEKEL